MPSDASHSAPLERLGNRPPVLGRGQTFESVTEQLSGLVLERKTSWTWLFSFGLCLVLLTLLVYAIGKLFVAGVGIWGVNVPVSWGFAIVNFVWWISIAHAGTLISATLLLLRQHWRNSIGRFAESMALFGAACGGLFPLLHLGRPYFFYWMVPYPNTMGVWPQFRSALVWDAMAVLAYFLIVLLFWYVGLIPDLATLRDRAKSRLAGAVFAVLALGWRGEADHWHRHQVAYRILAALATLLVVSMPIVALDFAITVLPGWHSTIYPTHFVAGALHSGLALALLLAIWLRWAYRLEAFITERHLQNLAKILLATSLVIGYGYLVEIFGAWYGGSLLAWREALVRMYGPYAPACWALVACNLAVPQLLWFSRLRSRPLVLSLVALAVLTGMWLERYIVIISMLHRDFLPSSWGPFSATVWDWALFAGTFGMFMASMLLFVRLLPAVSMFEVRQLMSNPDGGGH